MLVDAPTKPNTMQQAKETIEKQKFSWCAECLAQGLRLAAYLRKPLSAVDWFGAGPNRQPVIELASVDLFLRYVRTNFCGRKRQDQVNSTKIMCKEGPASASPSSHSSLGPPPSSPTLPHRSAGCRPVLSVPLGSLPRQGGYTH